MNVKCKWTNGIRPKLANGVISLLAPWAVNIPPVDNSSTNTGVTFEVPVLLCQAEGLGRRGVKLANEGTLVPAGQEVVVFLENRKPETEMLDKGDVLAYVLPQAPVTELG